MIFDSRKKALISGITAAALSLFPVKSAYGQGLEGQRHDVRNLDKTEYVENIPSQINFRGVAKPALSSQDSLHIFNPFIQPNDSTLVAYGSGDANKDGKIDMDDYKTIQLMIGNKTTDPKLDELMQKIGQNVDYNTIKSLLGSREFDPADVDGDGVITQADGDLELKFINGEIPYLPGHWNKLKTRQEREAWFDKCLAID